jgi:CRP-like cAMP-binding protein
VLTQILNWYLQSAYYYYLTKKSAFGEPFFLQELPQPIMYRVVKQMNEDAIRSVRLFHTYEMDFVVPLLLVIKPFQAAAGDVIYEEGDLCDSIVFIQKGTVVISSHNGSANVLTGYVRSGGYFGDMEYQRKTTCLASYSATENSHLLAVSHSQVNSACNKCLEAGVRFRKENQIRLERFCRVLKQHKKNVEHETGVAVEMSLEQSRRVVDRLLEPRNTSSTSLLTPRATHSSDSSQPLALLKSSKRKNDKGKRKSHKKRIALQGHQRSGLLWVDGAVMEREELSNLWRRSEQPLPGMEQDEDLVRVTHIHPKTKETVTGEVTKSYIHRRGVIHPLDKYKLCWDVFILALVLYSIITVPVEVAFTQQLFSGSNTFGTGGTVGCGGAVLTCI